VAEELGIQPEDIKVMHGDSDDTPYGLGTYASRSTPTVGAATAMVSQAARQGQQARRPPPGGVRGGRRVRARAGSR
jgi:CO/xanthine dehydrogenase Mo-binding subunit